jgi:hypothetical protein
MVYHSLIMYGVWQGYSGASAWTLVRSLSRRDRRRVPFFDLAGFFDLTKPRRIWWIKQALRRSGWPPRLVASALLLLLAIDLTLLFLLP